MSFERSQIHARVAGEVFAPQPRGLPLASHAAPAREPDRSLSAELLTETAVPTIAEIDQEVDTVEQRSAQPAAMSRQFRFAASTSIAFAQISTPGHGLVAAMNMNRAG